MITNLQNYKINENSEKYAISQYFIDVTFTCVPKSKYKYKTLIIIGYDSILNKSVLCCISLIMDWLTSTYLFLFNKLKEKFNFCPNIITCDYEYPLHIALNHIFPKCKIYGCYYHFIKNARTNLLKHYIKKKKM